MICNLAIAIRYVKERRRELRTFLGDRMNRLWWPQRRVIENGSERFTGDENDSDRVGAVFDAWREFCGGAGGRRGRVEFNQGDGGWLSQQHRRRRLRDVWFS